VLQVMFGGFGFVPISDQSEINIAVELPPGASLQYTTQQAERVAALARSHKDQVLYTYTTIGSASGTGAVDNGSIYVRLKPKAERDVSQEELAQQLRREFGSVGGVTAYTFASGFGGNQKQIQLQLTGPDNVVLNQLAEEMAARVRRVPGATDVGLSSRGQKPELRVQIQRGVAGQIGVSIAQIAQALRPAFAGVDAGTWVDPGGESRYVRVRLAPESRENAADVARIPLILPGGQNGPSVVPLGQVARIDKSVGPAQITHLDRRRVITVGANIHGASLGNVSQEINRSIAAVRMPPGYQLIQGGQVESQQEVFGNIFIALGIAVLLMYLILVVQFGSFLDPIAILVSLPLSLIGVVLALLITRDSLNIMSLIGVILLMGIVAKNAILLIDFAKWGHERGMGRHEALVEAGRIRLRPILMTTLALIAGMIPVALGHGEGGDFRAPLGRAVIGGVITSTLLTLFVIPTVYDILAGWRESLAARFGMKRPVHAEPVPAPGD
jgi:HAE1 family hydrophobic/amphiphilic exporter-1